MPDFIEGGGPRPPYKESFLENIVGVSWQSSGAIFVSGDFCCYERYVKIDRWDSDQNWVGLTSMAFGDGGGTFGSSYAHISGRPTFLLGGHGFEGGTIMRSFNGYEWESIGAAHTMGSSIDRIVWDPETQKFYADDGGYSRCYYSPDGLYWFFARDKLETYCRGPLQGVEDGVYGYDPSQDLIITPDPNGNEVIAIVNASSGSPEEFTIDVGLAYCGGIAFSGKIWMAGGGASVDSGGTTSATVSSVDGGNSWFLSTWGAIGMHADYEVTTIIGAPIKDFRTPVQHNINASFGTKPPVPGVPPISGTLISSAAIINPPETRAIEASQLSGRPYANRPQRPGYGALASAVSPPRRPRARLNRSYRTI